MSEKLTPPLRDGALSSAIVGSTENVGDWTRGASTAGSSRTDEDMEADGRAAASMVGLTGVDDTAWPPPHPAAAAAALRGADSGAANFFSTGWLGTGWAARGFGSAGSLGTEAALAAVAAAAGATAPINFAWFAALTAAGMAGLLAGAACFAACGLDSLHFSRSSSSSLPFW